MKFADYIHAQQIPLALAAKQLGVSAMTAGRWYRGKVVPQPKYIGRINEWSNGLVTANDFHGDKK